MESTQVRSSWSARTKALQQLKLTDPEKQHVLDWFGQGIRERNLERAQVFPNIFGHRVGEKGNDFDNMRKSACTTIFLPLSLLEATILRTLCHFLDEVPEPKGTFAVILLNNLVLRDKMEIHAETIEKMWRFYRSCIGVHEDREKFRDTWKWLMEDENGEIYHEECMTPVFLSKSKRNAFKKEWRARATYLCLMCQQEAADEAVECEHKAECRGSRWYHMQCVDFYDVAESFVCEECAKAMN